MDKVHIVGIGCDGLESLSSKTQKLINEADLLIGTERLLALFPAAIGRLVPLKSNLADIAAETEASPSGKAIVLASGDPNFYGIARYMVGKLGKARVEIVPNVSAMQLAFARIKESWDDATFLSAHGRGMEGLVEAVRSSSKVGIFTDHVNTPSAVAEVLLAEGIDGFRAYVCENLGAENERVTRASVKDLVGKEFAPLNVVVLVKESSGSAICSKWTIGIPDDEFIQRKPLRGLITKAEVRVVSLSKLAIGENSVVWDVGAGSGAVSVEAAFLAKRGRVYAVEKDDGDVSIILRNISKFGVSDNVEVVKGEAPEALDGLADPDSVFIGGSGGKMRDIVAVVARRLRHGGHVAINIATLENLDSAVDALREQGLKLDVIQLGVARGRMVGHLTRLQALDPVFVITGTKSLGGGNEWRTI